MQMHGLGATKSRLRNLLKYTDELLSFNEKVAFDLAREPYPHFHEFQVASLDGIETALDDETWLRIHRLRETRPPDCDAIFDGWVDFGPHPSADQPPQIRAGHGGSGFGARQHPTDRGVLMALVSITRDTGDFERPLRHARALVTLDSADTRLRSAVSDLEKPLPHWQARDLPPLWTN